MSKEKNDLLAILQSNQIGLGVAIAWGDAQQKALRATDDLSLHEFADGVTAWLRSDHALAALHWRAAQRMGIDGPILHNLIELASSATQTFTTVYTDGSYSSYDRSGGAACVYQYQDYFGMLTRHLPGPLDGAHHAEAAAILLALTTSELETRSLRIYSDSQTIINALETPYTARLGAKTIQTIHEIIAIRQQRDVEIHFLKSRTGFPPHDLADKLAKWVRTLGDWPQTDIP